MKKIYIISDGTGQSGLHIVRAAIVQFERARTKMMLFHDIDTTAALKKIVDQAKTTEALIAFTFVKKVITSRPTTHRCYYSLLDIGK